MIHSFCNEMGFPKEAEDTFLQAYDALLSDKESLSKIYEIMDSYFMGNDTLELSALEEIADKLNIHKYTLNMVFLIMSAKPLKYMYYTKGYSEQIYHDTMKDMLYKLEECRKRCGVWGTYELEWYRCFCKCNIFALGRMQFQPMVSEEDYGDYTKKGDTVYVCHIPSGSPLKIEDVYDSLDKAYEFFGGEGEMTFRCTSWLFYPPQYEMYKPGSNLRNFYDIWEMSASDTTNSNFWRVFYKEPDAELSEIVPKTSLEKSLLEHMKNGGTMGYARGYLKYCPKYHGKMNHGKVKE